MAAIKFKGATVNFPDNLRDYAGIVTDEQAAKLMKYAAIECSINGRKSTLFRATTAIPSTQASQAATLAAEFTGGEFEEFEAVWAETQYGSDGEYYAMYMAYLALINMPNGDTKRVFLVGEY